MDSRSFDCAQDRLHGNDKIGVIENAAGKENQ
jgi:hypothetical protein